MFVVFLHVALLLLFSFPNCAKKKNADKGWETQGEKMDRERREHEQKMKAFRKKETQKLWKPVLKKKKAMEKDLFNCPKTLGKGLCNCEERVFGFVSFMREEYMPIQQIEEKFSLGEMGNKVDRRKPWISNTKYRAESATRDVYKDTIEKAMESCLQHSEDSEMLKIYVHAHMYRQFEGNWERRLNQRWSTTPIFKYDFQLTPRPDKFWEKVQEMDERDLKSSWGREDRVLLHAYGLGYRLLRARAGNPYIEEKEEGSKVHMSREEALAKKWEEEEEKKRAEEKEREEKKKAEAASKEKEAVEKDGKEKKDGEKSKVSDDKKPDTDKKKEKDEKEGGGSKKSAKSKGEETDKNKEEDRKKSKEGSQKKSEGSKEPSKEKEDEKK